MIKSFLKLLTRCYRLALPYGRLKLFGVMAMILLNGLLQLIGITSVFPFFALAANPNQIRLSKVGGWFVHLFPEYTNNQLLALAGIFSIIMLVIASLGSLLSESFRIRYAYGFAQWLRARLLYSYAAQPYSYFLIRNTSDLYQKILDIQSFTQNVLLCLGEILSRLVLVLLLIFMVVFVQPIIALCAVILFGGFYLLVFLWLRPRTRVVSEKLQFLYVEYAKLTNQFLDGIKTVFVYGKSSYFIEESLKHSFDLGKYQSKVPIYSNAPRYFIEPIAFGGLVAIVVVMALNGRPFSDILPKLSVMALAGYRLLPALQSLYIGLVNVASSQYTLNQLEDEIQDIELQKPNQKNNLISKQSLSFNNEILLDSICFYYPSSSRPIINDLILRVQKNESVGIAGPSGSGKSTLVDIILGLHAPTSGRIMIDDTPLSDVLLDSWRSMIGYVSQEIYLLDDTIAANIAFGIESEDIDLEAVRMSANAAQILDFIEKELPQSFQTMVGERGVRLSGGQRQRIGLARALYRNPEVLILDEATSALDNQTELAVMDTIHSLRGKMTMITIAHRLSTLDRCDRIINLSKYNT